ncbi:hypothetical protein EMIT0357P_40048 [Pseudomonas marginalis]
MENNNSLCRHGLENIPARAFVSLMQRFPLPVQCAHESSQQLSFCYVALSGCSTWGDAHCVSLSARNHSSG